MVPEVDVLNALEIGISRGQLASSGEIHVLGGPRAGPTVGQSEAEGQATLEDPSIRRDHEQAGEQPLEAATFGMVRQQVGCVTASGRLVCGEVPILLAGEIEPCLAVRSTPRSVFHSFNFPEGMEDISRRL